MLKSLTRGYPEAERWYGDGSADGAPWYLRLLHRVAHLPRFDHQTGVWRYFVCAACGARRARVAGAGYSPIDDRWLNGGEQRPMANTFLDPPSDGTAVQPPHLREDLDLDLDVQRRRRIEPALKPERRLD